MHVTNQLEAAVIERADENAGGGKMALMAFMVMKVFRGDQCRDNERLEQFKQSAQGLNPHVLKLVEGIYVTPSGEELPMVNGAGESVRMPCYIMDPQRIDDRNTDRTETFSVRAISYFLENGSFRQPERKNDGWTVFRQAVGMRIEEQVSEDARGTTRQFGGVVFGRLPATPNVVEKDGRRVAMIQGGFYQLGYAAFLPAASVNMLLSLYPQLEPFFQRIVSKYSGIRLREEQQVRGLLPAPREQRKPEAKADGKRKHERRNETLDEKVARLTSELTEFEQKAEAAKGTPDEANANRRLNLARGRLTQAKERLEKTGDESAEAPASTAPEA
jgi:hypothetical protein